MIPRILCVYLLSFAFVNGAPRRTVYRDDEGVNLERIKALYVKNNDNGEERFHTGTGGTGDLNTAITNVQNLLERLRPTNSNSNSLSLGTQLGTLTGTGLSSSSTSSTSGVQPIIVSLGGLSSNTGSSSSSSLGSLGPSPITGLLPQIVGQTLLGNRRVPVRRRVGGQRLGANQNNRNQVYLIRPGQG